MLVMEYKRGQIYRVNLEPTKGSEQQGVARPCVILSITPLNTKLRQVGVVPLSSSAKVLSPVVVGVPSAGPNSVALCHQLRTIDKMRITKFLGELSAADMVAVETAVRQVYGL
jgi:mRNA interferase MazF